MNARIGKARPGENEVFGPFGFGREASLEVERPNRNLLYEFCGGADLLVTNTFMDESPERRITRMVPGATPMGAVTED